MEPIVVLVLFALFALGGALGGADSRDGYDWRRRKP